MFPFTLNLGFGAGEIYGGVSREGCIPSSSPGIGTCMDTGKHWEISPHSFAFSLNLARAAHPWRCEMPLPSPSPQSEGQQAAGSTSPLPLCCCQGLCPVLCIYLVPLPHPLLSARFLPGMGEMKEVVRGWRNPSTRERQAEEGAPGGSLARCH